MKSKSALSSSHSLTLFSRAFSASTLLPSAFRRVAPLRESIVFTYSAHTVLIRRVGEAVESRLGLESAYCYNSLQLSSSSFLEETSQLTSSVVPMTTSLILTGEDNLIYIIVSYRLLCELPVVSDDCLLYDVSRGFYSHSKPQLLD